MKLFCLLFKTKFFPLILCIILALLSINPADSEPIKVHPKNPRYFIDSSQKAIYMTGSATWYILHENGHPVDEQRIRSFLDWLQSWGHNYTRVWSAWFYIKNNMGHQKPWPYIRTGPGNASDGQPKFDLTKPNEDYFKLLRFYLKEIEKRKMYCSIMLFGSFNDFREEKSFQSNVLWHPANNVNAQTSKLNLGIDFFNMDPGILSLQKAHVRRMVNTLNEFDNFAWEIMNEAKLPESAEWQSHMIDYIREYEKTKPKQHLIIMSGGWAESGSILEGSSADIISPDNWEIYSRGGTASYSGKLIVIDTDHIWGGAKPEETEHYRKWVWKTFTRGKHPVFMDDYDSYVNNNKGKVNPVYDSVRKNLGYTLKFADKFSDLASMEPSELTSTTRYCLVNPGEEYLVYQPGNFLETSIMKGFNRYWEKLMNQFRSLFASLKNQYVYPIFINIKKGKYYQEWFDPVDGSVSSHSVVIKSDGWQKFKIPEHFKEDAVLYLKKTE